MLNDQIYYLIILWGIYVFSMVTMRNHITEYSVSIKGLSRHNADGYFIHSLLLKPIVALGVLYVAITQYGWDLEQIKPLTAVVLCYYLLRYAPMPEIPRFVFGLMVKLAGLYFFINGFQ